MEKNKILIYLVVIVFFLSAIGDIFRGVSRWNSGPTYTEEAVKEILRVKMLEMKIDSIMDEYKLIEIQNENLIENINADSSIVWTSSRSYRDSLRSVLFR